VVPVTYEVFEEAREALRRAPLRARLARATVGATRLLHL
jgi:hypothetical protein